MLLTIVISSLVLAILTIIIVSIITVKKEEKCKSSKQEEKRTGSFNAIIKDLKGVADKQREQEDYDTISLVCVKKKEGSGPNGLETLEELGSRLYRLNRNTFLKQEVSDKEKPFDKSQWGKIRGNKEALEARYEFENSHWFLLDTDGKINSKTYSFLTKKYKKKK